jgi:hypothetical protein
VPAQPLSADDLEQLLAPIALYPDALLAQILAASTYPAQVAVADQWLHSMQSQGYGSPDQIAAGAQAQSTWDPSVKALTAFPDVLDMLNHNLEWTTNLGNAYYNQPQDVMQTIQVLRQRAEQAGNLQSTPQEDVTDDQGYIQLAPANPQVVYVPTYDPWDVYGQPVAPYPGFSLIGALGSFFGSTPIQYGLGFAMAAFERMPFGWLGWGLDWLAHAILFDHGNYYSHSTTVADWGLPRGGPRAYYGRGETARLPGNSYRSYGATQRYNQRGDWYGNRAPAQSYVRPAERFPEPARRDDYSNRGYRQPAYAYAHPALPAHQTYDRPAQTYATPRSNFAYAEPYRSYRTPQSNSSRAFAGRPYEGYGRSMAKSERSSGFHLFGHEQQPKGFENRRAPKYSYGGGHAPKGFGHERAPRAGRSGGGHKHFF